MRRRILPLLFFLLNSWFLLGQAPKPGWARSFKDALKKFGGNGISAGMVEGFYMRQWAGTRYNIIASASESR